jgi:tetratricopeptide (TPR) repeat protein
MSEKKSFFALPFLSLILLAAVTFFAVSYIREKALTVKLAGALDNSKRLLSTANDELERSRQKLALDAKFQDRAQRYMEWQFVLREQTDRAGKRILSEANTILRQTGNKNLVSLLYYNLGLGYTVSADFNAALIAFAEAYRLNPQDPEISYVLGLLYSTYKQDAGQAVKYYTRFLELSPDKTRSGEVQERIASMERAMPGK